MPSSQLQVAKPLILIVLAGSSAFGTERRPAQHTEVDARFVLEIDPEGKLTLDGKGIAHKELAQQTARLAERVRQDQEALDAGKPHDLENGLPAVMVIRAEGETPFSTIYSLAMDCQASGFRRWRFALKSVKVSPHPTKTSEDVVAVRTREQNGLPAVLRTVPILLRADDRRMIGRVEVGEREFRGFEPLRAELVAIMNDPDLPFDQALLRVDARLRYSELTRVLNLLNRLKIETIHFSLAESGDAP